VYEIVSPYAHTDLYDSTGALQLHFTQSNDVFTITHPSYQARELKRSGPTAWAFNTVTVVPTQPAPTLPVATPTLGGAVPYTYAVTAIAQSTLEESVQTADATCNNDLTIAGHFNTITFTNAAGAVRYQVYKKINGIYGFIGQCSDGATGLVDNNITPNVGITPPIANDPISACERLPERGGLLPGPPLVRGLEQQAARRERHALGHREQHVLLDPDAGERRDLGAPHLAPEQHDPPHRAALRSHPAHLGR
jgi:hypothetical protein